MVQYTVSFVHYVDCVVICANTITQLTCLLCWPLRCSCCRCWLQCPSTICIADICRVPKVSFFPFLRGSGMFEANVASTF
ncbi:Nonribosomal peptide synthetase [Trichinella spiralis]|uniref:Nonribosomal peptide synthetase n=1 Tax=Trichinella spiralis TaxID=6334 RepID=A0ABR3KLZ2_TRISP